MMGSDKHVKRDKRKKDKKKRKRDVHSDSDSQEEARRTIRRLEKEHKKRQAVSLPLSNGDVDNAFGDRHLEQKFFWKKKVEKDVKAGRDVAALASDSAAVKDRERAMELERVKLRRQMNEAEFVKRQEEVTNLEHARLVADAVQEAAKEEQFHLKQAISRARRRIDEQRAQPIDELIRFLWLQATHPSNPTIEPYHIFEDMRPAELQQLMEEVEMFKALDVEDPSHAAYWESLYYHMKWKVTEEHEADTADRAALRAGTSATAVHDAVRDDIEAMFTGQTHSELLDLEKHIQDDISSGGCTDPEFWRAVQARLGLAKARTKVREIYRLKVQEALLERRADGKHGAGEDGSSVDALAAKENVMEETNGTAQYNDADKRERDGVASPLHGEQADMSEDESDVEAGNPEWLALSDGRFSPEPLSAELVTGQHVIHEDEDREELLLLRQMIQEDERKKRKGVLGASASASTARVHPDSARPADAAADDSGNAAARRHAMRVMGESADELMFRGEVPLESREYYWQEKYRPRKPKFFNRVHTGYDWNKYNRVHYDVDNPPPKVVQGYKFNIFYPDLIDKKKAPTYRVIDDPNGKDDTMCLLIFEAGPPYEDVAFQIVKKDWEHSHKKGFKNVFERDVLHLYFNFKRNPYRR